MTGRYVDSVTGFRNSNCGKCEWMWAKQVTIFNGLASLWYRPISLAQYSLKTEMFDKYVLRCFNRIMQTNVAKIKKASVRGSRNDLKSLLILLLFFWLGATFQKNLRLRRFKSDCDEIWQDCSISDIMVPWRSSYWLGYFESQSLPSLESKHRQSSRCYNKVATIYNCP